jgi:predicted peroxiredoxin
MTANQGSTDVDKDGNLIIRGFTTEMRTGIPFLIAQLKKSTKLKVPKFVPNNGFTVVNKADLW